MPSYGRPDIALRTVKQISSQIKGVHEKNRDFKFMFHLSINADPSYDLQLFLQYCDFVSTNQINEGAARNINNGFAVSVLNNYDYLWIIGDDEPFPSAALENITKALTENPDTVMLIGSRSALGAHYSNLESWQELYVLSGYTITFISAVIYKVCFSISDIEKSNEFCFTEYPYLAMQQIILYKQDNPKFSLIPVQKIVDYDYKIKVDPLKPRRGYGKRDSRIFFGRILSTLVLTDSKVIKREFLKWWRQNWHRFSMYIDENDFLGRLVFGYSARYLRLWPILVISLLPYWKLKELLRPVKSSSRVRP